MMRLAFAIFLLLAAFRVEAASTSVNVPITICPGSSCGASVSISPSNPTAGSIVTVTVNPGAFASSPNDQLVWSWGSAGRYNCEFGPNVPPINVQGPASVGVQVPFAPSEVPQFYVLNYMLQDTSGTTKCDGEPQTLAAISNKITVPPTITIPPITATPPADVTAYPAGWPNPPNRILTVCASGCAYTSFSDAAWDAANNSPVDFTQILLKPETYVDVCRFGELQGNPSHVWIIAKGGGMAKLTKDATPDCGIIGGNNRFQGQMILDNLDISEFDAGNVGGISTGGNCPNFLLRNVYLHDGGMGMIVGLGCIGINVTILNSRFTRLGGPNGPSHAIYLNDPNKNNSFTIKRSVFEGVTIGHTIKTHFALPSVIDCSMIVQAYNNLYYGSEVVDLDEGGGQVTIQNSLLAHGPYYNNNGSSNQFAISFGIDGSGGGGNLNPQYLVLTNDIFFNDLDGSGGTSVNNSGNTGNFVATGRQLFGANPPPPYQWTNSKFIGQTGTWQPGGSGSPFVTVPYYFPYCNFAGCPLQVTTSATDVDYGTPTTMDTGTPNSKSNLFYSTRTAAGVGTISPALNTYYLWPYDPAKFPVPAVCTQPIGNVAVP